MGIGIDGDEGVADDDLAVLAHPARPDAGGAHGLVVHAGDTGRQGLAGAQVVDLKGLQRHDAALACQPGIAKGRSRGQIVDFCIHQLERAQAAVRRRLHPVRHQTEAGRHQQPFHRRCGCSFFRSCKRTPQERCRGLCGSVDDDAAEAARGDDAFGPGLGSLNAKVLQIKLGLGQREMTAAH